jgi:hypothetical protein
LAKIAKFPQNNNFSVKTCKIFFRNRGLPPLGVGVNPIKFEKIHFSLAFLLLYRLEHQKLCTFVSSCPILEISNSGERLSEGAFLPYNSFRAK